jgi:hypothetical protein
MKIETIEIQTIRYCDADTSYLHQSGFEKRLAEYEAGDFGFVGLIAKATVSYQSGEDGARRLETLSSGGCWGIEDDSDAEHIAEIKADELADLKSHCEKFGVDVSDFDTLAENA